MNHYIEDLDDESDYTKDAEHVTSPEDHQS